MVKRLILAAAAGCLLVVPAQAAPEPTQKIELTAMMGRWYEVARLPNKIQSDCQAGASEWTRTGDAFAVVQTCRKGGPDGPLAEWKAKATVADPQTNAKFRMSFFGGLISQEYWVLEHRPADGWLILATANRKYLWLMSQKPTLPSATRAQALTRIRQLGFDPARLVFPAPARS